MVVVKQQWLRAARRCTIARNVLNAPETAPKNAVTRSLQSAVAVSILITGRKGSSDQEASQLTRTEFAPTFTCGETACSFLSFQVSSNASEHHLTPKTESLRSQDGPSCRAAQTP
jgi:hypothetical protein